MTQDDAGKCCRPCPVKERIVESLMLGGAFALLFGVVFGATNYFTGLHSIRVQVDFAFERGIPFMPAMLVFYMSIYPLFWLSPFVLRSRKELRALAVSMAVVTLIGGVCFVLFPAELAYPPPNVPPTWRPLYDVADAWNLDYNLAPSLHVALSILCVDVYSRRAGVVGRSVFRVWGAAIASSTLFTHQHHVLDVATGLLLGVVASRYVYPRWA